MHGWGSAAVACSCVVGASIPTVAAHTHPAKISAATSQPTSGAYDQDTRTPATTPATTRRPASALAGTASGAPAVPSRLRVFDGGALRLTCDSEEDTTATGHRARQPETRRKTCVSSDRNDAGGS